MEYDQSAHAASQRCNYRAGYVPNVQVRDGTAFECNVPHRITDLTYICVSCEDDTIAHGKHRKDHVLMRLWDISRTFWSPPSNTCELEDGVSSSPVVIQIPQEGEGEREDRLGQLASRCESIEARIDRLETRLSGIDIRLERMDEMLAAVLSALRGSSSLTNVRPPGPEY